MLGLLVGIGSLFSLLDWVEEEEGSLVVNLERLGVEVGGIRVSGRIRMTPGVSPVAPGEISIPLVVA